MNMNNLLTLDPAAMTGNEVVGIVVNLYDSLVELDPELGFDIRKINVFTETRTL